MVRIMNPAAAKVESRTAAPGTRARSPGVLRQGPWQASLGDRTDTVPTKHFHITSEMTPCIDTYHTGWYGRSS